MDAFGSGYLFGYLRRKAINRAKAVEDIEHTAKRFLAQRDALAEVIETLVPEEEDRKKYIGPLYNEFLRRQYRKHNLTLPDWLRP